MNHLVNLFELNAVLAAGPTVSLESWHGRVGSRPMMSDNLYTNRRKRSAQRIRKLVSSRESWIVWRIIKYNVARVGH